MRTTTKTIAALFCGTAIAALSTMVGHAYTTYAKWSSNQATFYINPSNADIDSTSAENALVSAMNGWNTQAGTPFRFAYAGRVNDTTTANDGKNVILFRNASNGSAIATTYSWYSGSSLMDADIVFWDGAFTFTAGDLGCSGAAYIEDVATHELGHALGLNHSSVADATMYPSYGYCSQELRSLASDDIAGAQALYGTKSVTNTAPSVSITGPSSTSFTEGTSITFAGSASDSQDGNLTAQLVWTSNLVGQIGTGGSFAVTLPAGTHVVSATATDSGGLTTTRQITITVAAATQSPAPPQTGGPSLSAKAYKTKGAQKVDLSWNGFSAASVDVFRNNVKVTATTNDGAWTDAINAKGAGSYKYKACDSGTTSCSNEVTVTF